MSEKLWHRDKTIFLQIGNIDLKTQIESWAASRGLEVFTGSGFDLIAVGCRMAIVEKEEVGENVWNDYLDYLRESEDLTPCIVLNSNRNEAEEGFSSLRFISEKSFSDLTSFLNELLQERLPG